MKCVVLVSRYKLLDKGTLTSSVFCAILHSSVNEGFLVCERFYIFIGRLCRDEMCGIFAYLNHLTPKTRKEILDLLIKGLQRYFLLD
jgi:hypothetical protein